METGKFGVKYAFYAVAAFVLAWFGYSTGLFILTAAVIIAEKDEWAIRQVLQACVLFLVGALLHEMGQWISVVDKIPAVFVHTAWDWISGIMSRVVFVLMTAVYVYGIVRVAKGKEARIPLAHGLANWACGVVSKQEEEKSTPAINLEK